MAVSTAVQAPQPEFARALGAFKRVIDAPRIRVAERVHAFPLTVSIATMLGAVK